MHSIARGMVALATLGLESLLAVPGAAAQSAAPLAQQAYVKATNSDAFDNFGIPAISGNTLVVGARYEMSRSRDVNGVQGDNSLYAAGAAYVYRRHGADWSREAYIKAPNADPQDHFGRAVAIDADTVVIGAYGEASTSPGVNGDLHNNDQRNTGAAYVYVREGAGWARQAYLKAPDPSESLFGCSVAVSGDTVVVGAYRRNNVAGAAYVYRRNGTSWTCDAQLTASNEQDDDYFGVSVDVSGSTVVIGAPGEDSNATGANGDQSDDSSSWAGAAYVFVRRGTTWAQQAYLKASNTDAGDGFGWSVGVSGDTLVAGALWEDSGATGVNGDQALNGRTDAGAAYVFVRNDATWVQQGYLKASNPNKRDYFGGSVAIDGETIVVGAHGEDSNATGVDGDQDDNSMDFVGAAYSFTRAGTNWNSGHYIKASNPFQSHYFGAVSLSGETVAVGATGESSGAAGVGGAQGGFAKPRSGAVYVFATEGRCESFCSSLDNATGLPARLSCSGAPRSDLVLTSAPVPGTVGQFVFGATATTGMPFGDGLWCLGTAPVRMTPLTRPGPTPNAVSLAIDYAASYANALSGRLYFQHWFRSGLASGAGFNTSNGLAVDF